MYDVIIIGGGPAGLTCAIYCARNNLNTLVLERAFTGGQAATTHEIENYPGFEEPIGGLDFADRLHKQAERLGAHIRYESVTEVSASETVKRVKTDGDIYECSALILATGASPRRLGLENEDKLRGMGVSYCATCDGMFFKNRSVAVVGGGDTAVEDAIFLSNIAAKVYLIHRRDTFRAAPRRVDLLRQKKNVEFITGSVITKLGEGIDVLEYIELNSNRRVDVNALFIAVGTVPETKFLKGVVSLTEDGYIMTDEHMKTSVSGVFACGDARKKPLRQIVTAASDGAIAAFFASQYILERAN